MPKKFINLWMRILKNEFVKCRVMASQRLQKKGAEITVVFLNPKSAQFFNKNFRNKNYPTDILSFSGRASFLGDLVICPDIIKRQAKQHGHSFQEELGYMLTHGVLHLLGYDHEQSARAEKHMMKIQDDIFSKILQKC